MAWATDSQSNPVSVPGVVFAERDDPQPASEMTPLGVLVFFDQPRDKRGRFATKPAPVWLEAASDDEPGWRLTVHPDGSVDGIRP